MPTHDNDINQSDPRLFQALIETVGEGITLSDGMGHFEVYNSRMEEITGYSKAEANACGNFLALLYPDPADYSNAMTGIQEIKQKRGCRNVETVVRAKNGVRKALLVSTSIMCHDNRELFLSAYRDITQRKTAEECLRKSERQLQAITSALGEGVFELDREGCLVFINPAAERMLGWKKEDLFGKKMHDIIHHHALAKTPILDQDYPAMKAIRNGETYRTSHDVFARRDGEMVPVSHVCAPVFDNGRIAGSVTAFHVITERLHSEQERDKLINQLRVALAKVKTLSGMLPVCTSCRKIRDDKGYWQQIEVYVRDHSEAEFSHGICPDCAKKLYPEYFGTMEKEGA